MTIKEAISNYYDYLQDDLEDMEHNDVDEEACDVIRKLIEEVAELHDSLPD